MNNRLYVRQFLLLLTVWVALGSSGCDAHDVPADWQADCVGRMQLSLPGGVDLAATTLKDSEKSSWSPPPSSFVDEQVSWGSSLGFLGTVEIMHGLTPATQKAYMVHRMKIRDAFRTDAERNKKQHKQYQPVIDLPVGSQDGFAFQGQGQRYLVLVLGTQVFNWDGYSGISENEAKRQYEVVLNGVRPRETFEVPKDTGVCLPYAFIRDEGTTGRHIAMTYRLKTHPDITVFLSDVRAPEVDPNARAGLYDPEDNANSFWSRYDSTYRQLLKSVWSAPYKRTMLADSKGVESFVKIVREGGELDYGYLVVARGDPHAKQDTPDLMLYVIQNSKNAKAKGIAPVGKDAFIEMAQTIAASVKRRPTSQ